MLRVSLIYEFDLDIDASRQSELELPEMVSGKPAVLLSMRLNKTGKCQTSLKPWKTLMPNHVDELILDHVDIAFESHAYIVRTPAYVGR